MKLRRAQLLTAMTFSLAVHVAAAAIFIEPEPEGEIAGGAATSELIIGTAFDDSLMAGEPGDVLDPVDAVAETQPVAAEAVETTDTDAQVADTAVAPVAPDHLPSETVIAHETGPVPPEQALAVEPAPALALAGPDATSTAQPETLNATPVIEALPAQSQELAALPPPREIEPAAEPAPDVALPDTIPLPVPRPEPPQAATAKPKPPAPAPKKAAKTEPRKAKADRETRRAASKPAKTGDGGKQAATASRSSSGTAAAKRSAAAGNAAVSNYPGKIASKLRRSLRYPREARRQGIRGDVVVSFVVTGNGGVSSIRIARSSGSPVLDGAAADAVRRAAPFPPIPADAGRSSWPFSVPLGFTR
ncbi:TonB family protein [Hoeflea sp. BAL378]|uniref:energy transducer TonB family protein n=1 Tax=Hoeflea sp. BAL378 TaxID=1547437 RepID=UPI00068CC100|nr:TonB family protein [Hoeflea sp. BAL378]